MVLNVTCNVEDTKIIHQLISHHGVLEILIRVLQDKRNDWPTHGAAQALMQYSHLSMQDDHVYNEFENQKIGERL